MFENVFRFFTFNSVLISPKLKKRPNSGMLSGLAPGVSNLSSNCECSNLLSLRDATIVETVSKFSESFN